MNKLNSLDPSFLLSLGFTASTTASLAQAGVSIAKWEGPSASSASATGASGLW